ncbi:FctA domain-containing protein [Slackia sp.]|uniref:Spy0128 family protein n=1 Tax=Slackia sp. TaxID=2049041 RepID=UPI00257CB0CE|nr:FctA domain-containing protein [Slackia sp.]MBS6499981.1 VWA domain-containing protein [Slackia sp.]
MKRLKMAIAALLAFALLPLIGSTALADESSASSRAEQIRAAANIETIADASTMGDWSGVVENTAQNIGRIWTDKTVSTNDIGISGAMSATVSKGDSDFITALSVLSSTSNIASTSTTPLDIVLVLDASGSMDDDMTGGKRIDALKNAANAFIDEIATQNASISDASKQHQVSIVKFAGEKSNKVGNDTYREGRYTYNYSQVMKNMTACSETTKSSFKDTINAIKPAGATNAAAGMELAQGQTSNRADAKKIVIFFTDGTPTTQSDFSDEVASDAISAAKAMKDAGASVYTIGIFDGANPSANVNASGTTNENKFMQAASSNYPAAAYTYTQYWLSGEWNWSFGDRAEGSDFYKSASSASELSKIFEDISKEIVKGAGYPTDAREGFEMSDGYITFDDSLGSYMQVDAFKAIVVNNHVFSDVTKTTTDTADTYTFAGTTELNGKTASLGNIVITVTKSSDVATGDKVQVKVPAGLIPLRNFNVNETAGTMTVSDTYPLHVFFTSSIKPDALALVANPDEAMAKYIAANTENGKVNFYANAFTPGAALGDAVSHFNPSKGNAYYYFTSDTPIYADEACTQPATRGAIAAGGTHYYQNHFFAMGEGGKAVEKTEVISFPSGTAEQFSGALAYDASGNAYFKAGTARLTYIDELAKSKAENITGTATDVLNPKWNSETSTSAATTVIPHLGNNGKLSVEIPGTLAVSKTLDMPEGFDAAAYADKSFDFELTVKAAADKTLHAEVKNAAGEVCGDPFELTFDENGKATHSIKADETLYVYGVAPNAAYSVEELLNVSAGDGSLTHANPGFLQSSPTDGEGKAIAATGTVVAGEVTKAEFVNTYAAQGTLEGSTALAGAKILNGRDWLSSDKFTFVLKDANTSVVAPMPEGASGGVARLEVTRPEGTPAGTQVGFHFGDIVYTQPGTYIYQIYESEENSTVNPGVSMSQALYGVKVVVADKHDGTLSVESAMTKLAGDDGVEFKTPEAAELAAFTNTFSDKSVTWNPSGTKTWKDATGQRTLESGMFFVMAKTIDASAPLPKGDGVEAVTGKTAADVDYRGVVSTVSASGSIAFPQATFSLSDLGGAQSKTYVYEITEVVKVGNAWVDAKDLAAGQGLPGVTYDPTVWQATVMVKSEVVGDNAHIELSVVYSKQGAATGAEVVQTDAKAFAFENSYSPKPAGATISGTKVFQGRAMTEAESFGFGLVPANKAATDAFGADFAKQATASGLANGDSKIFNFDELLFNKPGTYTFKMVENAYCGGALNSEAAQSSHIAFDTHECLVTVKVTDDHSGTLQAEVSYDGGATFTNAYSEEKTYGSFGGLAVEKTLKGRTMHAGEFAFNIEGADDASKALLKRVDENCSGVLQFSNPNDRAAGVADVMKPLDGITFTQADAGKTFEFVVSEVVPGDGGKLAGVTYDEATHKVEIGVSLKDGMNLDVATYVDGKLVESRTPTVAFANTYKPADVGFATTNFGLNKVLEGRNWTENDSFSFEITAETQGAPMPSGGATTTVQPTSAKDGEAVAFDFGSIRFTADDMVIDGSAVTSKTFVYAVSETVPDPAKVGIQYSTNVAKIYVTVTDDGEGHLVATSSTENGTFVNKYETSLNYTAAGGLTLTKILNGRDMTQGQFQIQVVPHDEASAAVLGLLMNGKVFDMPAAKDGKAASVPVCSDVEFTQLDAGKTFTYTVSELGDAGNGYTFDKAVRTVAISVSDDPATATLTATTTVSGGPDAATYTYKTGDSPAADAAKVAFVNSYAASGSVDVNATKTLSGRALTDGEFHFGVQYAKGEAAGSDVLKVTNAADGTVAFGTLNFDTAKLNELVAKGSATKMPSDEGVATWTIPCVAYEKTDGLSNRGITATAQQISFAIKAVDNGSGTLAVTIETGEKGLAFENTYGAGDASVSVTGVKHLSRAEGLTPGDITDKFTFSITANEDGAPMPERVTATNDVNGSIDFGKIVFTLDSLNKALGATQQGATADTGAASIQSAAPAANDVVAAGTTAGVEVAGDSATPAQAATGDDLAGNAADGAANADGAGQGAVPVSDDAVGLAAAGGAEPAAVDAASGTSDATPSGNASDQPTAPVASSNAVAAANAATDNAAASVQSAAPAAQTATVRSHVFTYTITETGSAPGVTNDTSVKTVSFKVTDNGKGELTVERVGDETKPMFEFTNAYSVTPVDSSVTSQITVSKSLVGRELVEGEFLFELVENGQVVARGANDAAGNVAMSAVTYTTAGKHDYVLREVGAGTTHNGVTFDGKSIAIHTKVVDNGEGSLVVEHAFATDDVNATFVNTYAHGTTSVVLGATKVLSGKALADGQFTFALTAEDGTVYQAKNDAAGSVAFPALTFAEPGTYVYTISEVNDKQANVTYDTATYNVVVNVVDDGQGNLVATVAYDDGAAPTFKNSYTEPPAPTPTPGGGATTPKNPVVKLFSKTADDAGLMLGAAAVAAGLALVVCGVAACWRRRS